MITPYRPGFDGLQADRQADRQPDRLPDRPLDRPLDHQPDHPQLTQPVIQPDPTPAGPVESAESRVHTAADKTRQQAGRWLDASAAHVRERPLQSVLVAAATGAVLMLLMDRVMRAAGSSR